MIGKLVGEWMGCSIEGFGLQINQQLESITTSKLLFRPKNPESGSQQPSDLYVFVSFVTLKKRIPSKFFILSCFV